MLEVKDISDKKKKRYSPHPDLSFTWGGGVIIEKDSTAPGFSCCTEVSVLCFY